MSLHIFGVPLFVEAAAPEANATRMLSALESLATRGHATGVFVFPEMCVPGYLVGDAWERRGFIDRCMAAHETLRQASAGRTLIFGSVGACPDHRGEDGRTRLYNAAFIFHDGTAATPGHLNLPFWPKTLLPNYREFDDSRHFYDLRKWAQDHQIRPGELFRPFCRTPLHPSEPALRMGITICEDAWSDDYSLNPIEHLSLNSDVVVNLSASPYTRGKEGKRQRVFSKRQLECGKPILYVNCSGAQNNGKNVFVFDGQCAWHDGASDQRKPPALFAGSVLGVACSSPGKFTRLPEGTIPASAQGIRSARAPRAVPEDESANPVATWAEALRYGLRTCLDSWGIRHVVVGASGGIDSSVSAALFASVLDPRQLTLINMPTRFNSKVTQDIAARLAANLGARFERIPIEEGVQYTRDSLFREGSPFHGLLSQPVDENLQARDRGSRILAAAAAALGGVFSCNSNKSELTVGYSTLYGDAAGFLAPLGDLWKGQVYELGTYLNQAVFGSPVIPPEAFTIKPSAELSADQDLTKGQGDPLVYPYHDRLFRAWVEGWERLDILDTLKAWEEGDLHSRIGVPIDLLTKTFPDGASFARDAVRWWNLYTGLAAVKRVQVPPVLVLSQRAFGFDHREAIGCGETPPPLGAATLPQTGAWSSPGLRACWGRLLQSGPYQATQDSPSQ